MIDIKKLVMETLNIDECMFEKCCKDIPEIDGWYFWSPVRGGLSMIINRDGEKLVANSSIVFEKHLNDFIDGKRN